ncbi:GDP-mannose 4,6-dehydratase [Caenispirillum bisanense]|uniref:GDP-mannose 4,6-dehydratase n=1 Tax=Caenispirillum bisanense TaxID=414052 RepID=UPI0031DD6FEE
MAGKTALITGITGQDGAYLARLLLARGYRVHGVRRRCASPTTGRIDDLLAEPRLPLHLHHAEMTDTGSLLRLVQETAPDEIYNLAAQSDVAVSFATPEFTADTDALGPLRLLEAVRLLGLGERTRLVQASTSELYGAAAETPQTEATPFRPRSPYAAAKLHAYWLMVTYREGYGLHAGNAILFNHESPLRGDGFVSRKITRAVARIATGDPAPLRLGNLEARRDWGHARDYAEGLWRMAQQPQPDDYVFATGESRSVREFVSAAFACIDRPLDWHGRGLEETGRCARTGAVLVTVDPACFRPTEVDHLCGDAGKARRILGWAPRTTFADLVAEMVAADLRRASHPTGEGAN